MRGDGSQGRGSAVARVLGALLAVDPSTGTMAPYGPHDAVAFLGWSPLDIAYPLP